MTSRKVLVVEDNDLNLKLFKDLLEAHEFEVFATQNGNEAIEVSRTFYPHVILMDIQLHGMSGFEVIRAIKNYDSTKNIPIIAVTAFAMKDDEERILRAGCEAYIAKPISIVPFLEVVTQFVNKRLQEIV